MAPVSRSYSETFTSSPSARQKAGSWLSSSEQSAICTQLIGEPSPRSGLATTARSSCSTCGSPAVANDQLDSKNPRRTPSTSPLVTSPEWSKVGRETVWSVAASPTTAFDTRRACAPKPQLAACRAGGAGVVDLVVERSGAAPAVLTVDRPGGVVGGLEGDRADHRPGRGRRLARRGPEREQCDAAERDRTPVACWLPGCGASRAGPPRIHPPSGTFACRTPNCGRA